MSGAPTRAQARRLRELYRSAGWPCQDALELELLAAGWLERLRDPDGRERVRLTDAGVAAAVVGVQRNRAALDAHQALVVRVAEHLQRAGRTVWTGLGLRAGLPREDDPDGERLRWRMCQPDVYSLWPSTRPDALAIQIHEVKVRRADLLGELRRPDKSAAYAALAGEVIFVLPAGLAEPAEIPEAYGVWLAHPDRFELARPAPRRACVPDFPTWLALARSRPCEPPDESAQAGLA